MPSLSNTARWYWTQYGEALELTLHGHSERGVEICLDLVDEPDLPPLLKALISLHLADITDVRQYNFTHKRRWISHAEAILQWLKDNPGSQQANIEHLEKQIARAQTSVDKQAREAATTTDSEAQIDEEDDVEATAEESA